jgi:hypothetical protein
MESKFFNSASGLRLKSKCYDEDTWQALSTIGRPSKRERKELIQASSATPLDIDIKAARATQTRHKFLAGLMLECHCSFGMCQNVSRFQLYPVLQFSFNSRDSKFVEQSVYIRNTWNTCLQGRY